jgi:hypothetical protein
MGLKKLQCCEISHIKAQKKYRRESLLDSSRSKMIKCSSAEQPHFLSCCPSLEAKEIKSGEG